MRKIRKRLRCTLGLHRRFRVTLVGQRAYSECRHCGIDIIRSRRGWRELRPGELPEGWVEKPSAGQWSIQPRHMLATSLLVCLGVTLLLSLVI